MPFHHTCLIRDFLTSSVSRQAGATSPPSLILPSATPKMRTGVRLSSRSPERRILLLMATPVKKRELDWSDFPPGTVSEYTKLLCLACIFDLFTAQLKLGPRTAATEIKRYTPTIEELTSDESTRPFFFSDERHPRCPYCDSTKRWHARLDTYRIEGGKATDAARRALVKSLPKSEEQFQII